MLWGEVGAGTRAVLAELWGKRLSSKPLCHGRAYNGRDRRGFLRNKSLLGVKPVGLLNQQCLGGSVAHRQRVQVQVAVPVLCLGAAADALRLGLCLQQQQEKCYDKG